ncbi:MAG: hypothetical protein CSA82_01050 [Actinobacteria bacterium]|nr:MAG: hypothetical protein CSA82_01050 [Actinomycetota bacterium]
MSELPPSAREQGTPSKAKAAHSGPSPAHCSLDGSLLTEKNLADLAVLDEINTQLFEATHEVADLAHCADVGWILGQFLDPRKMTRRKGPRLPDHDLLERTILRVENYADWRSRSTPRKKMAAALQHWVSTLDARRQHPAWEGIDPRPSLDTFNRWQRGLATMELEVIPHLSLPPSFERALFLVQQWDALLDERGYKGELFSLREELVRLNNWPGDQWDSGDDYASAQKRFHRRLKKARKLAQDPVRDRVMQRALYLREGLLLDPVDDVEWFLAVCRFRWERPEVLDPNALLPSEHLVDWGPPRTADADAISAKDTCEDSHLSSPLDVDCDCLTVVSGPDVMIDMDEDVVSALPPGCQVQRLIVSVDGPLGPDWTIYWVESEWEDSGPIMDLVESEKLHPTVLFVSDRHPEALANLVEPWLERAFVIPTHPLSAHSHTPPSRSTFPERMDAAL